MTVLGERYQLGVRTFRKRRDLESAEVWAEFLEKAATAESVPALCQEGCDVEPDGICEHGCPSVLIRLGLI